MNHSFSRRGWLVLLAIAVASTWISPFGRDLWVGDETKYSRVVWESLDSEGFLVPQLEGEPYAHKPPLHFWMLEALAGVLGSESIWTFVLPSLVAFVLLTGLAGLIGHRVAGGAGVGAAAIFATFWLAWIVAQTARMDIAFTLAVGLGALLIFEVLEHGRWRRLPIAGVAFGFAVLIKGPMAGVIGIALFAIEGFLRRKEQSRPRGRSALMVVSALVLMLAIPLAWLIPAIRSGGSSYGSALLLDQSLGRAFQAWVHAEPPWFYVLHFPVTFFPWFVIVILGVWHALSRTAEPAERRRVRFLVTWFFVVLGSFSLISSKLDIYMLPAMLPAAALAARYLRARSERTDLPGTGSRIVTSLIGVVFAILASAVVWLPRNEPELRLLEHPAVMTLLVLTAIAAMIGVIIQSRPVSSESGRTLVLGAVAMTPLIGLVSFTLPVVDGIASSRPLIESLERRGVPPDEIGLYWTPHLWSRSMPLDYHRVRYDEPEELQADPPEVIAVRRDHADDLGDLLDDYERVDRVRMISKDFDVYRRAE